MEDTGSQHNKPMPSANKKTPRWLKVSLLTIVSVICLFIIFLRIIDYKFGTPSRLPYSGVHRVWAHRGYVNGCEENSITSFTKAIDAGAKGVELDILYIDKIGYIVSHGLPDADQLDKSLKLEDVFKTFGSRLHYWLDYKNLRDFSPSKAAEVCSRLKKMLDKYNLNSNAYVESSNFDNLCIAAKTGLQCIHWQGVPASGSLPSYFYKRYLYEIKFIVNNISAISCDYQSYSRMRDAYPSANLYLFTANNNKAIKGLLKDKKVRVILTDKKLYNLK